MFPVSWESAKKEKKELKKDLEQGNKDWFEQIWVDKRSGFEEVRDITAGNSPKTAGKKGSMAYRLFEGKEHASIYQKYRFNPPAGLKDLIIQYLDKRVCPELTFLGVYGS